MFVLVLNIQAPGAVKHQCSPLMEKGGCSEGRERRSQASSLVEDLLELSKGYPEKMHLGLFNPNEGCLAYRFYLCHCHWCFPAVLWVSLRTTPTVPCAVREPGWSCSSHMCLCWQLLCLAPWHRDAAEPVQTLSSAGAGVQAGSPMPDEKSRCSPSSGHAEREPYQFDMFQQVLH